MADEDLRGGKQCWNEVDHRDKEQIYGYTSK